MFIYINCTMIQTAALHIILPLKTSTSSTWQLSRLHRCYKRGSPVTPVLNNQYPKLVPKVVMWGDCREGTVWLSNVFIFHVNFKGQKCCMFDMGGDCKNVAKSKRGSQKKRFWSHLKHCFANSSQGQVISWDPPDDCLPALSSFVWHPINTKNNM